MSSTTNGLRDQQGENPLAAFLPEDVRKLEDPQKDIPRIARDPRLSGDIEQLLPQLPSKHTLYRQDARRIPLEPRSVHLVVTSPPYWTLKEYNPSDGQLGYVADYEAFL